MGVNTSIEWADHSQNFWMGCDKVSPGCRNCYMFAEMRRYGRDPRVPVRTSDATFFAPLKSKKFRSGDSVFTCSWSDFFHEAADVWRQDAWDVIRQRPDLHWLILTKRTERIGRCLPGDWVENFPNVWLGMSFESQATFELRFPEFARVPARGRFMSYEPALERVDLWMGRKQEMPFATEYSRCRQETAAACGRGGDTIPLPPSSEEGGEEPAGALRGVVVDVVICGGESVGGRVFDLDWARGMARQCAGHGIGFYLKQLGSNPIQNGARIRCDDRKGGDVLEWPGDLRGYGDVGLLPWRRGGVPVAPLKACGPLAND